MVLQRSPKRRLSGNIARQANAIRIKSFRNRNCRAFRFFGCRFQLKVLTDNFFAATMNDSCRRPDFVIRKTSDVLLQEIQQSSLTLQRSQQRQSRRMNSLRCRCDILCFKRFQTRGVLARLVRTEEQAKRHPQPLEKRDFSGRIVLFHPVTLAAGAGRSMVRQCRARIAPRQTTDFT